MHENRVHSGTYGDPNSNYPSAPPEQVYIPPSNGQQSVAQTFHYPNSANGAIENNGPCACLQACSFMQLKHHISIFFFKNFH
jgi:hypothetical protein